MVKPGRGEMRPGDAPAHWQAAPAVLVLVLLFGLFASQLSMPIGVGIAALLAAVLAATMLARRRRLHGLSRGLALTLAGLVTATLVGGVALLIAQLVGAVGHPPSPAALLGYAALIWVSNVLVFALWYWEIDAGGPAARHQGPYASDDLVVPQQQRDHANDRWMPDFLDYLFLAFNSSVALSPTDTLVLSRRMKLLMMCQALISLTVLAVVASSAVNALDSS